MASIERTAYPRFKRPPTAQNLHALYTPTLDEIAFAQKAARPFQHQLSLLVLLKSFQRLGYFPKLDEVPAVIVQHVRSCLSLSEQITPGYEEPRTTGRPPSALPTSQYGGSHELGENSTLPCRLCFEAGRDDRAAEEN